MIWESTFTDDRARNFKIEYDEGWGYALWVYESGRDTHDYLQDTLDFAMDDALRDFGVPKSSWRQVG